MVDMVQNQHVKLDNNNNNNIENIWYEATYM